MVDPKREAALRRAIELMFFGYREFTDRPDRILERRGLGRVHHRILYFVGRRPGLSVTGLLEILAVSKQALNAPLRQLVGMGLVAMGADSLDRRVRRLELTEEGRRLEGDLMGAQARLLSSAFDASGPGGEAGWTAVMESLARLEPPPGGD